MQKQTVVVREFRGDVLFLAAIERGTLAFTWSADSASARRFETVAGALAASDLAAKEYGAVCYVRDAKGCAIKRADASEPVGVATRAEFRRIVTAAPSEHAPHCDEHSGFTDGCSACYSVHLENAWDATRRHH